MASSDDAYQTERNQDFLFWEMKHWEMEWKRKMSKEMAECPLLHSFETLLNFIRRRNLLLKGAAELEIFYGRQTQVEHPLIRRVYDQKYFGYWTFF